MTGWEFTTFDYPEQEEEMRTAMLQGWEPFGHHFHGNTDRTFTFFLKRPTYIEAPTLKGDPQ